MAGQMVTLMAAAALLWLWSTAWYPLERFPHSKHRRSFGLRDSGTSNSLLEKLRPCLFAEIHRCLHVAILCLAPILEGARWAFVERPWVGAGGLVCMALVATMAFKAHEFLSGPNARDWEYELLACSDPAPVPDASLKEILGKVANQSSHRSNWIPLGRRCLLRRLCSCDILLERPLSSEAPRRHHVRIWRCRLPPCTK